MNLLLIIYLKMNLCEIMKKIYLIIKNDSVEIFKYFILYANEYLIGFFLNILYFIMR